MTQAAAQRQQGDNGSENYGTTRSGSCVDIRSTLGARRSCAYYGAKKQYVKEENDSPVLSKEDMKYIQAVTGTLLYNARAVNSPILTSLSSIATKQAKPTKETMVIVKQLLDYCSTQEEAIITYNASKMILAVHSDAGYANEKKSRSRAG